MRITAIVDVPRTGDSDALDIEFSQPEIGCVTKRIRLSSCEVASGLHPDWLGKFLIAMRDAERDFAYKIFGREYRRHVGPMWGDVQPHELRLVDQAASLRPDLFFGAKEPV